MTHVSWDANGQDSREAKPRVAVIGGGIVGLAHAWAAARRGCQVLLFERGRLAQGASVRNFGMVWPIGQPNGPLLRTALHSAALWREFLTDSGLWHNPNGSFHLAYRADELAVLTEFARVGPLLGYDCKLIAPDEVIRRCPAARKDELLGGLWSPWEIGVDPREIIAYMPVWLAERLGIELHYGVVIDRLAPRWVEATTRERWSVDHVIVAAGADFKALYPQQYANSGLRRCKLQMMRTAPQPIGWHAGPMVAGGLTLTHYSSFSVCKSLAALKRRVAAETPELVQYGIHVMAAQNGHGEVVLGDSHEYELDGEPFDKACIDELILRELARLVELPNWSIAERWHGVYVKAPDLVQYACEPEPGVHAFIASGGAGMTMSFGLADQHWSEWLGPPPSCAASRSSAAHSFAG